MLLQVTPEKFMSTIQAIQPELYVALADEVGTVQLNMVLHTTMQTLQPVQLKCRQHLLSSAL